MCPLPACLWMVQKQRGPCRNPVPMSLIYRPLSFDGVVSE